MTSLIRPAAEADAPTLLEIINDAAIAYRGVIPADRWHEPYMSAEELARDIADSVEFSIVVLADERYQSSTARG